MSWFFISCKIQQNIFIFVSLSLIFCSKKISYQTFAPHASSLNKWTSLQKSSPPPICTNYSKFNAKFEESSLEFLHEKFLLKLMHVEEFPPIISNMYTFVHRVLFLYMKLHCAKLYFCQKCEEKNLNCIVISNFQNSRLFFLKITLFKKSQKF